MNTNPDEARRIINEVAQEKKAKNQSFKKKCEILNKLASEELLWRLEYWTGETKSNRKLDEVSMGRRQEAELWVEAIRQVISDTGTLQDEEKNSENVLVANPGKLDGGKAAVMTVDEAALYLRIPKSSLYKGTSAGLIPHRKMGRLLRFDKADLDEYLKSKKVLSADARNQRADEILSERGRKRR